MVVFEKIGVNGKPPTQPNPFATRDTRKYIVKLWNKRYFTVDLQNRHQSLFQFCKMMPYEVLFQIAPLGFRPLLCSRRTFLWRISGWFWSRAISNICICVAGNRLFQANRFCVDTYYLSGQTVFFYFFSCLMTRQMLFD